MKALLSAEEKKKVQIVAVSPDTPEKLRELRERLKEKGEGEVDYLLLSDAQASVIRRYGLLNEAAAQKNRLLPHPTTYVLDKKGKVTWKFTEVNYKVRPTNERVLAALRKK
ncbi:MAG: hypothetical protein A3F84_08600 [Candidatus Handelsmanbacteria bacterium RIFCSPLOWO2_12_FULL_64_10]|uniref:Alkyl hydroperoxide reductase subunit C/ Thiol specific antioxidant domain-containing protein n=1 Tax=Handelsmanbacteria sp. (strain RIFCSPLOWO2_12_FULL_64_10) TaxID=1817868 RepID=A0A1F6CBS6_HANXR|nr:MAG: hypothetical protein A3F84_08600 [Candidatus Handelsmanbacteria bacterium RIFCSPLOWO2_12_FULL_64_10]